MYHTQSFGFSAAISRLQPLERPKDLSYKELFRDRDNHSSNRSPSHRLTKEPLCMDSHEDPSRVQDKLLRHRAEIKQFHPGTTSTADGFSPSLLWKCSNEKDLSRGTRIHHELEKMGFIEKSYADVLITMYANCGKLPKAQELFDRHNCRNIIAWNTLIASYIRKGEGLNALDCFRKMQQEKILPNGGTYVSILKACALVGDIEEGKRIHDKILGQGLLEYDVVLGGALVDMYAKCGALLQAKKVVYELPSCDVISWNALITGYAQKGQVQEALECFKQMQQEGISPNAATYMCILKACSVVRDIDKGEQIHDEISRQGFLEHDIALGGALVDMYAKCGALFKAQSVLWKLPSRNVISWTALISGYAQKEQGQNALDCYKQMKREGIVPNAVTYVCILKACALMGNIKMGILIHDEISKQGLLEKNLVLGGALVDMYCKCGALSQARKVLKQLPLRDVVSWTALISGYAQKGQGKLAFKCFEQMQCEGTQPNAVTYVSLLKACSLLGAIEKGKQIHRDIVRRGLLEHSYVLGGALVDMYVKCGDLLGAYSVLENLPSCNIVSWNTLIAGYAQEGHGEQALKCFEQMQCKGILPDLVTFSCLLNMCNHLGLVEEGQELFDLMGAAYGLQPDVECFICIVDLLGRMGLLVKAVEVIQKMPFPATTEIWLCLLAACREWVDMNVGTWAFEQVVELDKGDEAPYVLMANIYAAAGMTEKAKEVEARMKAVGCSL